MSISRTLLYYQFAPLSDPRVIMLWQRDLCESLGLKGRILVSEYGINGTVGGDLDACKKYIKKIKQYLALRSMQFKWNEGGADDFPKLPVKVHNEIIAFGASDELKVDADGVIGGDAHLRPEEVNKLAEERGDDIIFFDDRNVMEAEIGEFKNVIVPDVKATHGFIDELESGKYDWTKDKPVISYCIGGIRCEILSALIKNRGFGEVYQIDSGIVRCGEKFGNKGLWEGSLYVFDKRVHMEFGDDIENGDYIQLGHCAHCGKPTNIFQSCINEDTCRRQVLVCDDCWEHTETQHCEREDCREVAEELAAAR